MLEGNGEENKELNNNTEEIKDHSEQEIVKTTDKDRDFELKNGKYVFKKGNQAFKKRRTKKGFSLREDLIKSLIRIKRKNKQQYEEIIDSYWKEKGMRQFLLEIVDGKARQSTEIIGNLENPIRIIEVKPQELPQNEAKL